MHQSKTSNTQLKSVGRTPKDVATDVGPFDPLDEFVFSIQDPNAITRDRMASAAREAFGSGPENVEFVSKLVEHMMSVSESRSKIVAELVILGGHLQQMMKVAITHHTGKVGNTFQAQKNAASLCFDFFQQALGITRSSARGYIRCHQKFGDNAEAVRVFSYGELNLLSAQNVTEEQIATIMEKKAADPDLTRADVRELLKALQRQEEAIDDRDKQLENIQELLEDNKTQLDVTTRESNHLRDQIAAHERQLADKEKSLENLRELLTTRTSGYGAMEKELADKEKLVTDLRAELKVQRETKPQAETIEVFVEKLPDSYANASQAVDAALAELRALEAEKSGLQDELAGLQSSIAVQQKEFEASTAVKSTLDDLIRAWADIAGKMTTARLAVQGSSEPALYDSIFDTLANMLRTYVAEIEAARTH